MIEVDSKEYYKSLKPINKNGLIKRINWLYHQYHKRPINRETKLHLKTRSKRHLMKAIVLLQGQLDKRELINA